MIESLKERWRTWGSDPAATGGLRDLRRGVEGSFRVVHALMLRESRTRYGRRSAGYVWVLISPILLLLVLLGVFNFIGRPVGAGDNLVIFFLTGIVPVYSVRTVLSRGATAVQSNRNLMRYPQVGTFEVVTARVLLELLTYFIVFILVMLGMFAFFDTPLSDWIDRPLPLVGALGTLAFLAYGAGFLSSQIGRIFEPWNEFTGVIGRILLLTSGVFFTLGGLPDQLRQIVLYNPVAHVIEWIRDSVIRDFASDLYDPLYPLAFGMVCLALGLFIDWLYRISGYDLQP